MFRDQTILHGEGRVGNCTQACLASILAMPLEAVPHFALLGVHHYMSLMLLWLQSVGYEAGMDKDDFDSEGLKPMQLHLIGGIGPRGVAHAVVGATDTGEMVHDPHPSRGGLVSITSRLYLFPKQRK